MIQEIKNHIAKSSREITFLSNDRQAIGKCLGDFIQQHEGVEVLYLNISGKDENDRLKIKGKATWLDEGEESEIQFRIVPTGAIFEEFVSWDE